ncbi:hypothetical protein [Zoogloea sp. LCSB751]|nr:hypothetical protein [Zoogloea sp. LCSB751]
MPSPFNAVTRIARDYNAALQRFGHGNRIGSQHVEVTLLGRDSQHLR